MLVYYINAEVTHSHGVTVINSNIQFEENIDKTTLRDRVIESLTSTIQQSNSIGIIDINIISINKL